MEITERGISVRTHHYLKTLTIDYKFHRDLTLLVLIDFLEAIFTYVYSSYGVNLNAVNGTCIT